MKSWEDVRRQITSISEERKIENETAAILITKIIERRLELGITQEELSRLSGIRQSNISRLESYGVVPTLDTLEKLAKALGLKLSLISYEEAAASGM